MGRGRARRPRPRRFSPATGRVPARAWLSLAAALLSPVLAAPAFEAQGHRGARGLYPENTLPGFAAALRIGVHTLELDTALTADGVPVVSHDPRLHPELTRDSAGRWLAPPLPAIHELSFDQVQGYDVGRLRPGSRYAERFPHQQGIDATPIPALAAVLALGAPAGVGFNIEFKYDPGAPADHPPLARYVESVLAAVNAAGLRERVTLQSFNWHSLRAVRERDASIALAALTAERRWLDNVERGRPGASPWTAGLDVDDFAGSVPRLVQALGARIWSPYWGDMDDAALREAHALGLRVIVWTVNERADMRALIARGVDGIITDYPDRLREVMAAHGLASPPPWPAAGAGGDG